MSALGVLARTDEAQSTDGNKNNCILLRKQTMTQTFKDEWKKIMTEHNSINTHTVLWELEKMIKHCKNPKMNAEQENKSINFTETQQVEEYLNWLTAAHGCWILKRKSPCVLH